MKLLISHFTLVFVIILMSCGGQKKPMFEKDGTLTFLKATYSKWVAGVKGGGAGYTIHLQLDPKNKEVPLDSLYFEKYSTSLVGNGAGLYSGHIDNGQNREIILPVYGEESKVKEVPSPKNIQTLFDLTGNEAVVSYTQDGIIKYYKLQLSLNTTLEFPR